jgi:hypothetical protein
MEPTYTMIGADGNQYGPITLAQMQAWVVEGRVTPTTQIYRSDTQSWLPAAQYVELGLAQSAPPSAAPIPGTATRMATHNPAVQSADILTLQRRVKSGAGWFFFIAVLSLVNSVMAMSGSSTGFVLGLAITQFIEGFGQAIGGSGVAIALVLNIIVVALFGMFGLFARKGHSWSFIAGMVLYGLDALLFLLVGGGMISLAFHAFALFCIFMGLKANLELKALTVKG